MEQLILGDVVALHQTDDGVAQYLIEHRLGNGLSVANSLYCALFEGEAAGGRGSIWFKSVKVCAAPNGQASAADPDRFPPEFIPEAGA